MLETAAFSTVPILLHRGFGDLEPQLVPLANNPWRTPGRGGLPHVTNQRPDLLGNVWAAGGATLMQPPVVATPFLLSGNHGARLHKDQGIRPAGPQTRQADPEEAIHGLEPWAAQVSWETASWCRSARCSRCSDARERNSETTKASTAENRGRITGDFLKRESTAHARVQVV
jgi:hypothetical protein